MKRKLLVVGSNTIHVYNFIDLIKDYFDEVLLLTNEINPKKNLQAIKIDFSLRMQSWKSIIDIRQILKEFQPSIIHIQQANSYAFLTMVAARNLSIPLVVTAWGSDVLINPKKSFLLKKMLQYVLSHAHVVTADSDYLLKTAQGLVDKKLALYNINFGVVVDDCPNIDKDNIIYSNRMHKGLYNIDKIIYSFAKFYNNNSDWRLVIAGSGDETEKLKRLVQKLGIDNSVEFVGFLNQKENYEYYCKSKIYVSVPQSDSISISLVEAMICKCVPFVSDLEANREVVSDGKNGFIVNDLKSVEFSKYQEMDMNYFEQSRKNLKRVFSKEYNKNRYIEIYKELIK